VTEPAAQVLMAEDLRNALQRRFLLGRIVHRFRDVLSPDLASEVVIRTEMPRQEDVVDAHGLDEALDLPALDELFLGHLALESLGRAGEPKDHTKRMSPVLRRLRTR